MTAPDRDLRPALLALPRYRRVWLVGAFGNAMRWLEFLVAGVYVFDATGSALMVTLVAIGRGLPSLLLGVLAGAFAEAINRRLLLTLGMAVLTANAGTLALLAATGAIQPWHVIVGAFVSGTVFASEFAVRRRILGEVVAPDQVARAVALDTTTNSVMRIIGPILGGGLYELVGLISAFGLSAALYLAAAVTAAGLAYQQKTLVLSLGQIPANIADGIATARRHPAIMSVLVVTVLMNGFGFPYMALVAPLGVSQFDASPVMIGLLAAAEPIGATLSGLAFAAGLYKTSHARMLFGGSLMFVAGIAAAALSPWYALAFAVLMIGGLGTAGFGAMQSTIILLEAPPAQRSRVLGLVTMCIGVGPLGALLAGALSETFGPAAAMATMAVIGGAGLIVTWRRWTRAA